MNKLKHGGARIGAGRKKGLGISFDIQKYCEEFIIELLQNEAIKKKAIKQLNEHFDSEINQNNGYVYIIKSSNLYKIGYSSNWKKRKQSYDTHNPEYKLVFLYKGNNAFKVESYLHKKYYSKNINGEWFNLLDSDIIDIVSYCSCLIN